MANVNGTAVPKRDADVCEYASELTADCQYSRVTRGLIGPSYLLRRATCCPMRCMSPQCTARYRPVPPGGARRPELQPQGHDARAQPTEAELDASDRGVAHLIILERTTKDRGVGEAAVRTEVASSLPGWSAVGIRYL